MKKLAILIFIPALLLFACTNEKKPAVFSTQMLARQTYSINNDADTTIETLHGSKVNIKAASFGITGMVELEIREAFTPAEIFAAGLITEADGRPLRSGGMIYINAKQNGKQLSLKKPVKLSIPNNYFDAQMKVYKGVETDSGTINWTNPLPMDSTPQQQQYLAGQLLFREKCASCHRIFKTSTAPGLKDVELRGPWGKRENILSFIRNPAAYMATSNYCRQVKAAYGGQMMTAFADLDKAALDQILAYINNEAKRPGAMQDEQRFYDSLIKENEKNNLLVKDTLSAEGGSAIVNDCGTDTIYRPKAKEATTYLADSLQPPADVNIPENKPIKAEVLEGLRRGFSDLNATRGMYDFEINTLGWYNVDANVEGCPGTMITDVKVLTEGDAVPDIHVYLFCPSNKTLSVSYDTNTRLFTFKKINGGIPLYIGERMLAFAFGSKGSKMYYGITEFRVKASQQIKVIVKETTAEEMQSALYNGGIDGIELGIEEKEQMIIHRLCGDTPAKADSVAMEK